MCCAAGWSRQGLSGSNVLPCWFPDDHLCWQQTLNTQHLVTCNPLEHHQ